MTDSEVMQDFFDTFAVMRRMNSSINVEEFLAGRHGLLDYAPNAESDPRHVLSCIKRIHKAIGSELLKTFVTLEQCDPATGLDDVWSEWCPCPPGVELHKADYPAGALPLWSNGKQTVFCRITADDGGFPVFGFAVTE